MEQITSKTTLSQRIIMTKNWWVETHHSSTKAFEDMCDISNSYFNTMQSEPTTSKRKTTPVVSKIAKHVKGINLMWLLTGEGEMLEEDNAPREVLSPQKGAPYYDVDFLGGFDTLAGENAISPTSYIHFPRLNDNGFIWCNITGDSMAPLIKSGSFICIKEVNKFNVIFGDIYAIVVQMDDDLDVLRTVKYVVRSDDRQCYRLVPENKEAKYGSYQDIKINNILHIFKVVFTGTVL